MSLPLCMRRPQWWPLMTLPVLLVVSYYFHQQYHLRRKARILVDQSDDDVLSQIEASRLFKHLDPEIVYDCVTWRPNNTKQVHTSPVAVLKPSTTGDARAAQQQPPSSVHALDNRNMAWGGDNIPTYETGSSLLRSEGVIAVLYTVIEKLKTELGKNVIKLLDLPCGYHQHVSYLLRTRDDIDYTGADIVPTAIHVNQQTNTYKDKHMFKFKHIDIVSSTLNESYDIILCRMMLQHLTYADVMSTLYHFSESGSRYLIATTFSDTTQNTDVKSSGYNFRRVNLEISPINVRSPVCSTRDSVQDGAYLAMWQLPLTQYK